MENILLPCKIRELLHIFVLLTSVLLNSCGGGGSTTGNDPGNINNPTSGENNSTTNTAIFSVSTAQVNFAENVPSVAVYPQSVTATLSNVDDISGTLYILINIKGTAVNTVSEPQIDFSTRSGGFSIIPADSSILGPGTHTATVTISACLNDQSCTTGHLQGSPQIINVTYTIGHALKIDTLTPYIAIEEISGEAVIRSLSFLESPVTSVKFGDYDAVSFSDDGETQIHAIYPALSPGTYPVRLYNTNGELDYAENLVVIPTQTYSAASLEYIDPNTNPARILYDNQREALFVASVYNDPGSIDELKLNHLIRYQFSSGEISSIDSKTVADLRDLALSPDGSELLLITNTKVMHLNPETLDTIKVATFTQESTITPISFIHLSVTNEGIALITSRTFTGRGITYDNKLVDLYSTSGPTYAYNIENSEFYKTSSKPYLGTPGFSGDGSLVLYTSAQTSPPSKIIEYKTPESIFKTSVITAIQRNCYGSPVYCIGPVIDQSGSKILILDLQHNNNIYNTDYSLLGSIPDTHGAAVMNLSGEKVYTYDSDELLRTFDLKSPPVDNQFLEIGSGIGFMQSPGPSVDENGIVKMVISADDNTVFIAGENSIVVQPLPQ